MANWAWCETVISGDQKQLKEFYAKIRRGFDGELVYNNWKNTVLDYIPLALGYSEYEIDDMFHLRGHVDDIILKDYNGKQIVHIKYSSAYNDASEMFETILKEKYPGLSEVHFTDEPNGSVYINTDTNLWYFKFIYKVETSFKVNKNYIEDLKELFKDFNNIFKTNVSSVEEIQNLLNQKSFLNKHKINEKNYCDYYYLYSFFD